MYSLDCLYYDREFNLLIDLINDVISTGMDPNYEITLDGQGTGELLFEVMSI